MFRQPPIELFTATVAGSSLAKTLFPGAFTCSLSPDGNGISVAIVDSNGATVGGLFSPGYNWSAVLIDVAAVGAADKSLVLEFGKVNAAGGMAIPVASVTLKSISSSGTIADVNPYTGVATPAVTWRLFDLATITNAGAYAQLSKNVGGGETESPSQLFATMDEAQWYYLMTTDLDTLTSVSCYITPYSQTMTRTKAGP